MKNLVNYIVILIIIVFASNCASESKSLSGGPKDTIPPVVLKEFPAYDATDVSVKRIEITFNEYVKIKDAKSFIVSPPLKSSPIITTRGKRVIVQFDSTLNENTTYLFDFGNSIVDLNESNPLGDYRLRFSTGDIIDSLHISGLARHAFTFDSVKNMKVMLYKSDVDSLPFTTTPDAVAHVSNRGFFVAEALKNQPYRVIAIEDKNNNNIYDAGEMVGFIDSMIMPLNFSADTMTVGAYERDTSSAFDHLPLIRIFQENINKQYLNDYKREQERKIILSFAQRNPEIRSMIFYSNDSVALDSTKIISEKTFFGDTITYWFTHDSIPAKMYGKIVYMRPDTTGKDAPTETTIRFKDFIKIETTSRKSRRGEEQKEETPKLQIATKVNETLVMEIGFELIFNAPLTKINREKINLYEFDDEGKNPKKVSFSLTADTANLCIYKFQANKWESGLAYDVEFLTGAFSDIYNLENDSVRKRIQTPNIDKFSILELNFKNTENNYIIQLLRNKKVVQTKQINYDGAVKFSFIEPDMYSIRIIEDKNNNGRWDTGSLQQRLQPERVKMYRFEDGKNSINLRQGWENIMLVDVKQLFSQ